MTPVETLEAAIDVLDTMRALAAHHPWGPVTQEEADDGSWAHYNLGDAVTLDADFNSAVDRISAELIVTLYRTIDAQLALLQGGIRAVETWLHPEVPHGYETWSAGRPAGPNIEAHLALAGAILGGCTRG